MAYFDEDPDVRNARSEVRQFKSHLVTYGAVVGVLFVVNFLSGGFWNGNWWFLWVAGPWGIFVALQAVNLFGDHFGRDWEDRMVRQVVAKRRRDGTTGPETGAPPPPSAPYTPPQPPPLV